MIGPWCILCFIKRVSGFTLVSRSSFSHSHARMHVELLGPCFKTGRLSPCLTDILFVFKEWIKILKNCILLDNLLTISVSPNNRYKLSKKPQSLIINLSFNFLLSSLSRVKGLRIELPQSIPPWTHSSNIYSLFYSTVLRQCQRYQY